MKSVRELLTLGAVLVGWGAWAQVAPVPPPAESPPPQPSSQTTVTPPAPPPPSAPPAAPAPVSPRTEAQPPLTTTPPPGEPQGQVAQPQEPVPAEAEPQVEPADRGRYLDGQPRYGAFLSGPGSFTFIMHHTLMGAAGGLLTQAFANSFRFDQGSREAMLAGTLIGAGLGFGSSAWWQFNNWVDRPMAQFGIANALFGGAFGAGFANLFTDDSSAMTWAGFAGAELGAWLTAAIGGGQMPLNDGLLVASGGGWALAYTALLLAVVHFSGSEVSSRTWTDTLLVTPALGAAALALATMKYHPTTGQIVRANLWGSGVGVAVLALSGLVLGFKQPTPYVLSFLGSAGAITTVSLLWEESAERPPEQPGLGAKAPYRGLW